MQQQRKKGKILVTEVSGVDEKSDEGASSVKVAGMGKIILGCCF